MSSTCITEFTSPMPIMEYMYGILSNRSGLREIEESSINRLLSEHHATGFLILRADRSDQSTEVNKGTIRNLINDIREFGASYFPFFVGYQGKDDAVGHHEPSVIVTAFTPKRELIDFGKMKDFANEMCSKYGQDSVIVAALDGDTPLTAFIGRKYEGIYCFPQPTTLNESYRRSSYGEILHI